MTHQLSRRAWTTDRLLLGCDYNPEQWPESTWSDDIALMREAGVDLVALNVFGWASLEPRPGEFDFDALDRVIGMLADGGIGINLGTGTASPPAWLTLQHPEILPVAVDGTTRWPGGRQGWCPSSPVFRSAALRVVEQVASRYAEHPAVELWHVSNELGCHNALCYCDVSASAFRRWLENRYGSIEHLNSAWGTSFWSQRYGRWEEILPPRATLSAGNPAHRLDFARFSSDELLDYFRSEADILRAVSGKPVTTNLMVTAHIRTQDYWGWAGDMDVIANDHYLDHRLPVPRRELSFAADLTRGLAAGRPWMLMENSTSAVSWQPHNIAKRPGEMMRNTLAHVARGADAACFFQWRASRQGAEKFHSALLPHAGTDSLIWRSTLELSSALERLSEVAGSRVEAPVALIFSWESWWAAEGESQPSSDVVYLEQVHAAYDAFAAAGVTVDIVAPGADLTGYALVVIPCLYLVDDRTVEVITEYVREGGTVFATFFSGIVDATDTVRVAPTGPGAFTQILGGWTEAFFPLLPGQTVELTDGTGATIWTEVIRPTTAEVQTRFADGPVAGEPAVTRNTLGAGTAWYVGTALEASAFGALARRALVEAGVAYRELPESLEVVMRSSDAARYLFAINHGDADVTLAEAGTELLTQTETEHLVVPAGAVRVLRQPTGGGVV